jgi:flagellar hook assembly protein FlgD
MLRSTIPLALIMLVAVYPTFASVEISGISVTVPFFSPDGNGIQDLTGIRFDVASDHETVYIWVTVRDDLGSQVRTIAETEPREPGTVSKVWDGRTSSGQLAGEGTYTFEIVAMAGSDSDSDRSATVVLDTTTPAFTTLIYPNPYTPELPFADTVLVVDVTIVGSQLDDWLSIWIANDVPAETLCTNQIADGDTTYTCLWDGRGKADGIFSLVVRVWDRAGNSDMASYLVDLDLEGPLAEITYPNVTYMSMFPDSVKGRAFDRNGIESIGLRFYSNTEYMVPTVVPDGDTLLWHTAWPESLMIEDQFRLELRIADSLGYESTKLFSVTVDMTAPEVPSFDPLPRQVSDPNLSVSGTSSGDDSVLIYLNDSITGRVRCSSTGIFQAALHLQLGDNWIYAEAKDQTGNRSSSSAVQIVTYTEDVGICVPERLGRGSRIEVNLDRPADLVTLRIFSADGYYIASVNLEEPELYSEIQWDLKDSDGNPVRNGLYLLVFEIRYDDGKTLIDKSMVVVSR